MSWRLKGNQGTLLGDVSTYLDDPACEAATAEPTVDADHGRIETRTATVSTNITWLQQDHHWPGLAAIGKVIRIRETATKNHHRNRLLPAQHSIVRRTLQRGRPRALGRPKTGCTGGSMS